MKECTGLMGKDPRGQNYVLNDDVWEKQREVTGFFLPERTMFTLISCPAFFGCLCWMLSFLNQALGFGRRHFHMEVLKYAYFNEGDM